MWWQYISAAKTCFTLRKYFHCLPVNNFLPLWEVEKSRWPSLSLRRRKLLVLLSYEKDIPNLMSSKTLWSLMSWLPRYCETCTMTEQVRPLAEGVGFAAASKILRSAMKEVGPTLRFTAAVRIRTGKKQHGNGEELTLYPLQDWGAYLEETVYFSVNKGTFAHQGFSSWHSLQSLCLYPKTSSSQEEGELPADFFCE